LPQHNGNVAPVDPEYPHLRRHVGVDFGLLPETAIGAGSLNVIHYSPKDLGILDLPIIFGSVRKRILPGLSPPVLGFVGAVQLEPRTGEAGPVAPAAGAAVRLADRSVAKNLDSVIRTLHFLATLGRFDLANALFGVSTAEEQGHRFKVADFGSTLVRWIKDPGLAALANLPGAAGLRHIAFGRIDDWYLICTQEAFFRQCVNAHGGRLARFADTERFRAFATEPRPKLLFTAIVDSPRLSVLADHITDQLRQSRPSDAKSAAPVAARPARRPAPFSRLNDALNRAAMAFRIVSRDWRQVHTLPSAPPVAKDNRMITGGKRGDAAKKTPPKTNPDRALKPLRWASDVLRQRHTFAVQVWRGSDGAPRGLLRIVGLRTPTTQSQKSTASTPRSR